MDTRDRLAAEFGLKVEQVDEWLQRAAIDVKQLARLPYEEDLWIRYEWAPDKRDAFIDALIAAVRGG